MVRPDMPPVMRTTLSRLFAGLVATALVLGPVHVVHAEPPGNTVDELFPYGQEKFDAEEFGEAGDAWAKAVGLLPEDKKNSATRQTLMNLALDAYLRAYKADDSREHIDKAKTLLDEYEAALQAANGTVELTPEIADLKQKIDDALADIKAKEDEAARLAAEAEAEKNKPVEPPPPEPEKGMKPGTGLIIGGAVLLGLGAGGIGLLAAGAVGASSAQKEYDAAEPGSAERDTAQKKGETMNALLVTGAVIAPIFIGAGIALVILGLKKNKKEAKSAMLVPTFGPNYAGVGFTGRF
jgi:hypothetical protein